MVGVTIADPRTALKASVAALVSGEVLFPDVNGNIIQDSKLFWDNTNKRLGVSTSTPTTNLEVSVAVSNNIALRVSNTVDNKSVDIGTQSSLPAIQGRQPSDGSDAILLLNPRGQNVSVGSQLTPTHQFQLPQSDDAAKTTTNTWTVTSDKRLKKNITPFIDGLAVLLQLNPINFQFTGDGGTPKDAQGIGLAAQDIENITPYMIRKTKGKIKDTDLVETDIYKMNNHALVYILVNAVKELSAEVTTLRNRLASAGIP